MLYFSTKSTALIISCDNSVVKLLRYRLASGHSWPCVCQVINDYTCATFVYQEGIFTNILFFGIFKPAKNKDALWKKVTAQLTSWAASTPAVQNVPKC